MVRPAVYTSKTSMVVAMLREQILTGELVAGAPLRQRDLAERLGVSPTPIREALRRLESEGLVTTDTHRGATVSESEHGPSAENYLIRAALEGLAAGLAADRISGEELDEVRGLNDRMKELGSDSGDQAYGELNREFHLAISRAANSPMLMSLLRLLWQALPEGPKVTRSHAESTLQHDGIIAALEARDGGRARALVQEHILGTRHLDHELKSFTGAEPALPQL